MAIVALLLLLVAFPVVGNDCETCDKTVAVLFEFNDGRWAWADVLVPEPANAWCATIIAADKLGLDLEYSFSQYGVFLESVGDVSTPDDFSRYWGIWSWSHTESSWDSSTIGALDMDVDNSTIIAWSFVAFGDPAPSPTPVTRHPWLSFRGGWRTSGFHNDDGPQVGGLFWSQDMENGPIDSTLTVADGRVFGITAGIYNWTSFEFSHLPTVVALDSETGEPLWEYEFQGAGGFEIGSPAYHGGVVYATSSGRNVLALDAKDGSLLWETEVDEEGLSASPAVANGKVLVGTGSGRLVALGISDGKEVWSANVSGWVYLAAPAVMDGVVYIGTDNETLHALSMDNGTEVWVSDIGGRVRGTPLVTGDRIYVISGQYRSFIPLDGSLHALDMDGKELWNVTIGTTSSSPARLGDSIIVGSSKGLYSFKKDGTRNWLHDEAGPISTSPAVTTHMVYVLSNVNDSDAGLHSAVVALDALGNVIWKRVLEPHNWALSSVALSDGRVFAASDNGWAYSIGDTTLLANFINVTDWLNINLTANETAVGVEVVEYKWHLGDDTTPLFGPQVTYEFPKAGTYEVTLTIVDEFGRVVSVDQDVTVEEKEEGGGSFLDDPYMLYGMVGFILVIVLIGMVVAVRVRKEG